MTEDEIRKNAYAMPVHRPAYPRPPFRFLNREYFIIQYETDLDALRAVVPEPLTVDTGPEYVPGAVLLATTMSHHGLPSAPYVYQVAKIASP